MCYKTWNPIVVFQWNSIKGVSGNVNSESLTRSLDDHNSWFPKQNI